MYRIFIVMKGYRPFAADVTIDVIILGSHFECTAVEQLSVQLLNH